ncbi:hypothetical protein DFH06DRAFT_1130232 [Mycena polygramma]|nr:hypothetical protein DFH06DRAFT_1130232 [Mycena polygramma]
MSENKNSCRAMVKYMPLCRPQHNGAFQPPAAIPVTGQAAPISDIYDDMPDLEDVSDDESDSVPDLISEEDLLKRRINDISLMGFDANFRYSALMAMDANFRLRRRAPLPAADLQRGEQYTNSDFVLSKCLQSNQYHSTTLLSYDTVCRSGCTGEIVLPEKFPKPWEAETKVGQSFSEIVIRGVSDGSIREKDWSNKLRGHKNIRKDCFRGPPLWIRRFDRHVEELSTNPRGGVIYG